MHLFKLTNESNHTYKNTLWGENVTHEVSGTGAMCGPGWLHAYTSPALAFLMNPIHADIRNPQLWLAEGEIGITDNLKVGCKKLTTIKRLENLHISEEKIKLFAIKCALEVIKDKEFVDWTDNFLHKRWYTPFRFVQHNVLERCFGSEKSSAWTQISDILHYLNRILAICVKDLQGDAAWLTGQINVYSPNLGKKIDFKSIADEVVKYTWR